MSWRRLADRRGWRHSRGRLTRAAHLIGRHVERHTAADRRHRASSLLGWLVRCRYWRLGAGVVAVRREGGLDDLDHARRHLGPREARRRRGGLGRARWLSRHADRWSAHGLTHVSAERWWSRDRRAIDGRTCRCSWRGGASALLDASTVSTECKRERERERERESNIPRVGGGEEGGASGVVE